MDLTVGVRDGRLRDRLPQDVPNSPRDTALVVATSTTVSKPRTRGKKLYWI